MALKRVGGIRWRWGFIFYCTINYGQGKEGMRTSLRGEGELNEILRGRRKDRWESMHGDCSIRGKTCPPNACWPEGSIW